MNVFVRSLPLFILSVAGLVSAQDSRAQSVATNPVGYVQLTCTAASDTTISVPFQQPAAYVGATASTPSGSTITLSGSTGWTANQFVYSGSGTSTYYALLGPNTTSTNSKEGASYLITANGTNSLTVALNGDNISAVPAGTQVSVIAYWTVGTVFPATSATTAFIVSTSPALRQTQILVPNYSGTGIALGVSTTYYYYNSAWREVGDILTNSHNDDILLPDGYVIVRNPSTTTTLTAMGNVDTGKQIIPLATESTASQDNFVSVTQPMNVSLNNLGLISSGAFLASTSPALRTDQLLVYSGTTPTIAPAPTGTYFYYVSTSGTGWRLVGDSLANDHGNDVIPAGSGFIIRKAATSGGQTAFWQSTPTY